MMQIARFALFLIVSCLLFPGQAAAQTPVNIDIAAGRLDRAIFELAKQAGISIGLEDPALGALQVGRIRGRMTARQAMQLLLKGEPARSVRLRPGHWRIVRQQLPAPVPRSAAVRPVTAISPPIIHPDIIVTGRYSRMAAIDGNGVEQRLGAAELGPGLHGKGTEAVTNRLPVIGSTQLGPGRNRLFLRGIADSSFNGPNQAVVGQYLGEARLNYNAPDPDLRLVDLRAIEVHQGPQGAQFGAGTLGGVIRLQPRAANLAEISGRTSLAVGATEHGDPSASGSLVFNLPLVTDRLGLRAVIYGGRDGGFIDDRSRQLKDVNRVDTLGGRLALRIDPGASWEVELMAAGQNIRGRDSQYADGGGNQLSRAAPFAQPHRNRFHLGQLRVSKEWDALTLRSVSNFVDQNVRDTFDTSFPGDDPSLLQQRGSTKLYSHEMTLSRRTASGGRWKIGANILNNIYRIRRQQRRATETTPVIGIENETLQLTAFGDLTLPIDNRLSLSGGARLSHFSLQGKSLDGPTFIISAVPERARRSQTAFLPSAGLHYQLSGSLQAYARYQEGFRPGGIAVRDNMVERFHHDSVAAWETGLHYRSGQERGVDAGINVAYTRWRNIQADLIDNDGLPATENIGSGRIWTVDATIEWRLLPGLAVDAAVMWAGSRLTRPASDIFFRDPDSPLDLPARLPAGTIVVESDKLPNVPGFSGRFGATYQAALSERLNLSLAAWVRYTGKSRLGVGPVLGVEQGNVTDTGLSASLDLGRQTIWLQASNLFDARGNRFALGSPFTLPFGEQITPLRPRSLRIGLDVDF